MAAFVLTLFDPHLSGHASDRLDIFPGAATPSVFPANTAFWIGYGFAVESGARDGANTELSAETTFELIVDGRRVPLEIESRAVDGRPVARQCIAEFEDGLPAGWHRFEGRWYEAGALRLTSGNAIEFVEP